MATIKALKADALYRRCDPALFDFQTTEDLEDLTDVIGQPRAVGAVQFGIGIGREGYNIFAMGPVGTGKHSLVNQFLETAAAPEPTPPDLCYVHNFRQPHRPQALQLPAGMGAKFRQDMGQLVEELRSALPAAFESEEYRMRRQVIGEEFQERERQAFEQLQQRARERGLSVFRTPQGLMFAPLGADGEAMPPETFQKLPEEERKRIEKEVEALQRASQDIFMQIPRWEKEIRERVRELNREVTNFAVGHLIDEVRGTYQDLPYVVNYLNDLQQDIIENARDFLATEAPSQPPSPENPMAVSARVTPSLRRYQVNLVVDNSELKGAPVVYEDNPTYQNLVGRMEHRAEMGALLTDFSLIRAGALHRANGGYLVLDARKVLMQPVVWEELKRSLKSGQIRIESLGQAMGLISTVSLEPQPVPLDVKVVLIGNHMLYYMLQQHDPEFGELFKVQADFSEEMDRNPENQRLYAQVIATMMRKEGLRAFDRTAVGRVIEQSSRMVEDSEKLSIHMRETVDLLREADYWTGKAGKDVVTAAEVQQAIEAWIYRSDRVRERMQEEIGRGTILIDTEGEKVGQINGLSVLQLGGFSFGRPSRITARVRLGRGEVVDIEREVELSGPLHSKGVLILSGFLGARYAMEHPLSLSASLVFEQSYGGVDGDSASSAELYALLSAIAEAPIKQSLAVTGSVNQHGQVQAIGGVNQKIEGFFDICQKRGVTGEQGVLIPASNVTHLMLRQDVVQAVADGQFHIYPVETIDQGIELLTGIPAGNMDETGDYPEGSINARVKARLAELAEKRSAFNAPAEERGKA